MRLDRQLISAYAVGTALALTACSQMGSGTALTPAATSEPARAQRAADAKAFSYDPHGVVPAPNAAWAIVPGTLRVTFARRLRVSADASAGGFRVTLPYPPQRSAEILAARAAIVQATYANGKTLRWPQFGNVDAVNHRLTIDVPNALLDGAATLTVTIAVDSRRRRLRDEPPGPRYWDGRDWQKTGKIKPNVDTVVLIHGIFSSVESAFPTGYIYKCPNDIAKAQGFAQVLGFDYDWFEPPQKEGALFADFLKTILAANVSSLTIEAHSYGSLVTLAAVPKLGDDAKIANLVTLGGPLPLRGTPLAEEKNGWRMHMMLGLLDWYLDYPPDVVDKMLDTGMVASLATNSDTLKQLLKDYEAMKNQPHFVQAAGTQWICFIPGVTGCNYSEETFKKILVDDGRTGVQLPWDGIVETIAATSTSIPDATAKSFPLSHVELECTRSVINWVAQQLK